MKLKMEKLRNELISITSLFTSVSTLICCALPIFLVTLGLGAVMAGLVSNFPFLITLSEYKNITFLIGGSLIALNFWLTFRKRNRVCEIDKNGNEVACDTASRWSKITLWISILIYAIGFAASYLYAPLVTYFSN